MAALNLGAYPPVPPSHTTLADPKLSPSRLSSEPHLAGTRLPALAPVLFARGLEFVAAADQRKLAGATLTLFSQPEGFALQVDTPGAEPSVYFLGKSESRREELPVEKGIIKVESVGTSLHFTAVLKPEGDRESSLLGGLRSLLARPQPSQFVSYTFQAGPEGGASILEGRLGTSKQSSAGRLIPHASREAEVCL